jgi:Dihydrodipicolinate synthetase family
LSIAYDPKTTRRAHCAQQAGAAAVTILPASRWKLSEREFLKPFLSIGDAIRILIMIYNNPATSGVDMSPELLVRMFETIDNLTMVKGCTGDLSRMRRVDQLSGGWLPFYNGINPLVLDALQAGAAGLCTAGGRVCAHSPASTCTAQKRQANCQGHKPFTLSSCRCWSSSWWAGRPPRRRPAWGCWASALGMRVDPWHRLTTRAVLRRRSC